MPLAITKAPGARPTAGPPTAGPPTAGPPAAPPRHESPDAEPAVLAARTRLTALLDSERGIEAAEAARREALDELRRTVKDLAAQRYPSLERFYEAVVQAGRAEGLRLASSTYTVRNALVPGPAKQTQIVQLAARVVLAAPPDGAPEGGAR